MKLSLHWSLILPVPFVQRRISRARNKLFFITKLSTENDQIESKPTKNGLQIHKIELQIDKIDLTGEPTVWL